MKIKTINDYVDEVHKVFNSLSRKEIESILKYGFRSYYLLNVGGSDVLIDTKQWNFTAYTGKLFKDGLLFYKYWKFKHKLKLRIKYKREKKQFDGKYYFGLTEELYQEYKNKIKGKKKIKFDCIQCFKILEECMLHKGLKHIFVLDHPEDKGMITFLKNVEIENYEYIYKRTKDELEPIGNKYGKARGNKYV